MTPFQVGPRIINLDATTEIILDHATSPDGPPAVRVVFVNGQVRDFTGEEAEILREKFGAVRNRPHATAEARPHVVSDLGADLT